MRYKNDKKISNLSSPDSFFQAQNAPKSVFGQGSAPDLAGGAYDAPPDPLVVWEGGYPLPIPLPARRLRRLELGALGASIIRPPSTQNPGYASGSRVLHSVHGHEAVCRTFTPKFQTKFVH